MPEVLERWSGSGVTRGGIGCSAACSGTSSSMPSSPEAESPEAFLERGKPALGERDSSSSAASPFERCADLPGRLLTSSDVEGVTSTVGSGADMPDEKPEMPYLPAAYDDDEDIEVDGIPPAGAAAAAGERSPADMRSKRPGAERGGLGEAASLLCARAAHR